MNGREADGATDGGAGFASEGRNHPGLLTEQEPEVTPSKRNSDAHCQTQCPQPGERDIRGCAVHQGWGVDDSE